MNIYRIELLVWLLLLARLADAKVPRGYRTIRKPGYHVNVGARSLQGMMTDAAIQPALANPMEYDDDDKQGDDEQGDDDQSEADDDDDDEVEDEKEDDDKGKAEKAQEEDEDEDTDSPTTETTSTLKPTTQPTLPPSTSLPTPQPSITVVEGAIGDPLTEAPTNSGEVIVVTVEPPTTASPSIKAPTAGPVAAERPEPTETPNISTTSMMPTITMEDETIAVAPPTMTSGNTISNATTSDEELPHPIQLDPLYLYVTMQGEGGNEEGFMQVLVDYMEYYMAKDFDGFEAITYGVSTFSMITKYPSISRASSSSTMTTPTSTVTVHIHRLTAIFAAQPSDPDWAITDYMEMLLENEIMLQDYIDSSQPNNDVTIRHLALAYEDDTVHPTDVVHQPDGATGDEEEEKQNNIGAIVGWTVGAFVVLLWVVYLYGIQSRYHQLEQ